MTHTHRRFFLLPLAAAFAACSSSSTAPSGNTTTNYAGTMISPAASGSFTAAFVTASADRSADATMRPTGNAFGREVEAAGGPSATITITLLNGTILTLTGSISGTSFTVSDGSGDSCTGTVSAALMNATCTILGVSGIDLAGALAAASGGAAPVISCGLESQSDGGQPDASIVLAITPTTSFIGRVSMVNDSLSFYSGTATATTVSATETVAPSNVLAAAFVSNITWIGTDVTSGGTEVGVWSAATPCYTTPATVLPNFLSFSQTAGSYDAADATKSMNVQPSGTIGPIQVVVPATATWLTATAANASISVTVGPMPLGTYTDTLQVYAQFASNAPVKIPVDYEVSGAP